MNQFKLFAVAALLVAAVPSTSLQAADLSADGIEAEIQTGEDWATFSTNLVAALNSDHLGRQEAALRYAIQYKGNVELGGATISMMKLYRDNPDDNMRRLAVVALASLDSPLVDGYLTRAVAFENDAAVLKTIKDVLAAS